MDINYILKKLTSQGGVSGDETSVAEIAREFLVGYVDDAIIDKFGNVIGSIFFDSDLPTVLLDAHIDEIGMIVTYIDERGFLKIERCGGIDRRALLAQPVTVLSKKPMKGVVCTLPPHVAKDSQKVVKEDEIAIDIGYSREDAESLVALGDRVVIDANFAELLHGRVASRALDDRAGVAAILYALDLLQNQPLSYNVKIVFASREETGGQGAEIASYNAKADLAIAVDVSFGYFKDEKEESTGKMGGGAMIGVSPSLDNELTEQLKLLAKRNNIPYQFEVMGGKTGTDADKIVVSRGGVRCALLSIPQFNMHTPVEIVETSDIEATGKLIAAFLKKEKV